MEKQGVHRLDIPTRLGADACVGGGSTSYSEVDQDYSLWQPASPDLARDPTGGPAEAGEWRPQWGGSAETVSDPFPGAVS